MATLVVAATRVPAQDLEPRAYANTPVGLNFLIAGYSYTRGDVATDPALPIKDANLSLNTGRTAATAGITAPTASKCVWPWW